MGGALFKFDIVKLEKIPPLQRKNTFTLENDEIENVLKVVQNKTRKVWERFGSFIQVG